MIDHASQIASILNLKMNTNLKRSKLNKLAVDGRFACIAKSGALATWTEPASTGRSPKNTFIVKNEYSQDSVDWTSPNNKAMTQELFDEILIYAKSLLEKKEQLYRMDRVAGAVAKYAFPVTFVTDSPLASAFIDNMFRPVPRSIEKSLFYNNGFTLIALPYDKLNNFVEEKKLQDNLVVVMDLQHRIGLVVGSAYMGSMKKMIFTVMNYYFPHQGILTLHASANEGSNKKTAILLGLSGTGKTTLSADPHRALLGDDEHAWSDSGVFNFENGIYAKMIDINRKKEPAIYDAVMHEEDYKKHGAIVENAYIDTFGNFNFLDRRLTENSRASIPLTSLKNVKKSSAGGHPVAIIFLTADAYGVLPPISKLSPSQAMLWFLMGYTSKLAGTETGVTEPEATFSRFFGQPFMPALPSLYASMLGAKMKKHRCPVYLVNTGWTGGPYGVGKRIDIDYTRAMVNAAINGDLKNSTFVEDKLFHLSIPTSCSNVPSEILLPQNTWQDKDAYLQTANKLASIFKQNFDRIYGDQNIADDVRKACPGM